LNFGREINTYFLVNLFFSFFFFYIYILIELIVRVVDTQEKVISILDGP